MRNFAKTLLLSVVLATGAIATENYFTTIEIQKGVHNDGTINITPNSQLKIASECWIHNTGEIIFKRNDASQKFKIVGTDVGYDYEGGDGTSGIKNYSHNFDIMDPATVGTPDDNIHSSTDGVKYYRPAKVGGKIQVVTGENEPVDISAEDYIGENGGTILSVPGSLYKFLKKEGSNETTKVIIFRDIETECVTGDFIALNYTEGVDLGDYADDGMNGSSADKVFEIRTPFCNSDALKTFTKDDNTTTLDKVHFLSVNGYYKFVADNSEFKNADGDGLGVKFTGGISQIASPRSIFPVNTNVSDGQLRIDVDNSDDKVVTFDKELSVNSNGKFSVAEGSTFVLEKNGTLNLGF